MAVLRILAALSLLSTLACSGEAPASASQRPPPIHYDQTSVLTGDGQPKEEQSYRTLLENCRKAGGTIRPLTPDDAQKIGRVHVEAWIGPDKQSRREEQWHLASTRPCDFSLTHQDQTEIVDANGRSTMVDGVTHETDVQETGKPAPVTALPATDGDLTEGARRAGWSKQGTANANGTQCAIWQNSSGFQLCVWTGGRQWGYSCDGSTALKDGMSRGDAIVLWAHPGQGATWKLDTKGFSVGTPIDRRAFEIPDNAAHGTPR
jgi:hypothetical protein